jgi:hypothetical protein
MPRDKPVLISLCLGIEANRKSLGLHPNVVPAAVVMELTPMRPEMMFQVPPFHAARSLRFR